MLTSIATERKVLPRTREEEAMPIKLEDIRAGVWITSAKPDEVISRRRMFCSAGRSDGKLFVVSDTGHLMCADANPGHLMMLYKDWKVEK